LRTWLALVWTPITVTALAVGLRAGLISTSAVALRTLALGLVRPASARRAGLGAWLVAFGTTAGLVCFRCWTGFSGLHRLCG
jgi:hypothetical protein